MSIDYLAPMHSLSLIMRNLFLSDTYLGPSPKGGGGLFSFVLVLLLVLQHILEKHIL